MLIKTVTYNELSDLIEGIRSADALGLRFEAQSITYDFQLEGVYSSRVYKDWGKSYTLSLYNDTIASEQTMP